VLKRVAFLYETPEDAMHPVLQEAASRFIAKVCPTAGFADFDLYDFCVFLEGRPLNKYVKDKLTLQFSGSNKAQYVKADTDNPMLTAYELVERLHQTVPTHPSVCGAFEPRNNSLIAMTQGKEVGQSFRYSLEKLSEIRFGMVHPENFGLRARLAFTLTDRETGKLVWDTVLQSSDISGGFLSVRLGNPERKARHKRYYAALTCMHAPGPEYPALLVQRGYSGYQYTEDRGVRYGSLTFCAL
jgi:hypothetical protein